MRFSSKYWKLNYKVTLLLVPIGLVIGLGGIIYEKYLQPDVIDSMYCYFITSTNEVESIYIYPTQKEARKAIKIYKRDNSIGDIFLSKRNTEVLWYGDEAHIVKYHKKGDIAKVHGVIRRGQIEVLRISGWIPTMLLHDTIE